MVNEGKSRVPNATLLIYWPYEVENGYPQGKHLLYLMEEPKVSRGSRSGVPMSRAKIEIWKKKTRKTMSHFFVTNKMAMALVL